MMKLSLPTVTAGLLLGALLALTACGDRVARHQLLTTIMHGEPSMPPAEKLCRDLPPDPVMPGEGFIGGVAGVGEAGVDVSVDTGPGPAFKHFMARLGLTEPTEELCQRCHVNLTEGEFVHPPVSAGECFSCHYPHETSNAAFLVMEPTELCLACHDEERAARKMHESVIARGMTCSDCHNPHYGSNPYFLD